MLVHAHDPYGLWTRRYSQESQVRRAIRYSEASLFAEESVAVRTRLSLRTLHIFFYAINHLHTYQGANLLVCWQVEKHGGFSNSGVTTHSTCRGSPFPLLLYLVPPVPGAGGLPPVSPSATPSFGTTLRKPLHPLLLAAEARPAPWVGEKAKVRFCVRPPSSRSQGAVLGGNLLLNPAKLAIQ